MTQSTAQIITSYGRRYIVRTYSQQIYEASTRSKRTDYACGDFVNIQLINQEQVVIESVYRAKVCFIAKTRGNPN